MEDMRAVLVHMNPLNILAIDVAAQMRPFVDNQTTAACLPSLISKSAAEKASTNNQIVIVFNDCKDKKLFQKAVSKEAVLLVCRPLFGLQALKKGFVSQRILSMRKLKTQHILCINPYINFLTPNSK